MSTTRGTVHIGSHVIDLPEEEARALFLAAGVALRSRVPLVVTHDTTAYINEGTQLSLTIEGGFRDEYNPQQVIEQAGRTRAATVM